LTSKGPAVSERFGPTADIYAKERRTPASKTNGALPPLIERPTRRAMALLPQPLAEFLMFGVKQAWACLFAGLMLALLIGTSLVWDPSWPVHRYDALFGAAISIQVLFLLTRLETFAEARVIFLFHLVGTVMELFKTHVGSWSYPEEALIRLGGVPLFSGFMYAAVGSYMARAMRVCTCGSPAIRPPRRPGRWLPGSTSTSSPTTLFLISDGSCSGRRCSSMDE
jgi:hypothetical protein